MQMAWRGMKLVIALIGVIVVNAAAQAPSPPGGVTERELTVPGPVPLPGTLTLPAGKGP